MIELHTKSAEDTREVAAEVAQLLQPKDMLLVSGDLGAGKTTFTQGLGRALGIKEPITSPTFVLICTYKGRLPLYHVDVYRLGQLQEVIDLGLNEMLDDGGVAVVEWGELAAPVLPHEYLAVRLYQGNDDDERRIQLDTVGSAWTKRDSALQTAFEVGSPGTELEFAL